MSRRVCLFCGETHPATVEDTDDLAAEPVCAHWIGRRDPESGFEADLSFLNDLELPPLTGDDAPTRRDVDDAFGEWAPLAKRAYSEGFTNYGDPFELLLGLRRTSRIRYVTIDGTSVMGWSYTDFFAENATQALEDIRIASVAILEGVTRLQKSRGNDDT